MPAANSARALVESEGDSFAMETKRSWSARLLISDKRGFVHRARPIRRLPRASEGAAMTWAANSAAKKLAAAALFCRPRQAMRLSLCYRPRVVKWKRVTRRGGVLTRPMGRGICLRGPARLVGWLLSGESRRGRRALARGSLLHRRQFPRAPTASIQASAKKVSSSIAAVCGCPLNPRSSVYSNASTLSRNTTGNR